MGVVHGVHLHVLGDRVLEAVAEVDMGLYAVGGIGSSALAAYLAVSSDE